MSECCLLWLVGNNVNSGGLVLGPTKGSELDIECICLDNDECSCFSTEAHRSTAIRQRRYQMELSNYSCGVVLDLAWALSPASRKWLIPRRGVKVHSTIHMRDALGHTFGRV